jgi:hypothetical protein
MTMAKAFILAGIGACLFVAPALAHHSFAMFDHNKTSSVAGTVKEFEWINPHVWLHVTAAGPDGKPVTWSFEAGGIGQLAVSGWKPDTAKPGDKVTVGFHPLKDGSHGGMLLTTTWADGKSMCQGPECRAAAGVKGPGD